VQSDRTRDGNLTWAVAVGGHPEALHFLREKGCNWDAVHEHELYVAAAEGGHVLVMLKATSKFAGRIYNRGLHYTTNGVLVRTGTICWYSRRLSLRGYGDKPDNSSPVEQSRTICGGSGGAHAGAAVAEGKRLVGECFLKECFDEYGNINTLVEDWLDNEAESSNVASAAAVAG
jgi:hypothetical protein